MGMTKRARITTLVLGGIAVIVIAQWISICLALSYERPAGEAVACAEYEVRAINIFTGALHTFPNPCFVPPGWIEF